MGEITSNSSMMMVEGFDSNSSNSLYLEHKRSRHDNSPSSLRYKGVVLQQNGHWGAQIYANHQRIWLGTFKSEKAAAMAYDSAAMKIHSSDFHRNFPWTNITIQEPGFQELYATEAVLNMIKDGSYESKFNDYVRTRSSNIENIDALVSHVEGFSDQEGVFYQQLFQKELTPSDVGKLNRLVIPKKHAIKYFPHVIDVAIESERGEGSDDNSIGEEVEMEFLDCNLKTQAWRFRYCYWKSSQSFVFTRGWNRFVKYKKLQAKDIVIFYKCKENTVFCIDVRHKLVCDDVGSSGVVGETELKLDLGGWFRGGLDGESSKKQEEFVEMNTEAETKSIRLFGADISSFNEDSSSLHNDISLSLRI